MTSLLFVSILFICGTNGTNLETGNTIDRGNEKAIKFEVEKKYRKPR